MAQTTRESILEKIANKLKETDGQSDGLINSETLKPVSNNKVHNLIENVQGSLENIHKVYTYHLNAAARAKKDYDTYVYVLEALFNEYNDGDGESTQVVNKEHHERKASTQAPAPHPQPHPQPQKTTQAPAPHPQPQKQTQSQPPAPHPQPQPQKTKESAVVAKAPTDEKQKEKSGRFKFSFP